MALAGAGGFDEETRVKAHSGQLGYADLPDYCWTAEARLDALDGDDISQSVLYPTMLLTFQHLRILEFAEMQCRAYNDWLSDLCADGEGPPARRRDPPPPRSRARRGRDPSGRRRCPTSSACRCDPNPAMDFKPPQPRRSTTRSGRRPPRSGLPDRLPPAVRRTTCPARCRACGSATSAPSDIPVQDQDDYGSDNIFFAQALGNPVDMMSAVMFMTAGGVLDRFPDLRVVFLEANGGWIVPWLERLDHHFHIYPWDVPWLTGRAVGDLPPPVLDQLRRRRVDARVHRPVAARRRRPDRLGVGLPPSRREVPGHHRRVGARTSPRSTAPTSRRSPAATPPPSTA